MIDWGVWISGGIFAVTVLTVFVRIVQRLTRMESRVEVLERDGKEIDAHIARLTGLASVQTDLLNAMRIRAAESYVSLEHMNKVEDKIDGVANRTGTIETTQAGHGATLKAIQDTLGDIKRTLSDRR